MILGGFCKGPVGLLPVAPDTSRPNASSGPKFAAASNTLPRSAKGDDGGTVYLMPPTSKQGSFAIPPDQRTYASWPTLGRGTPPIMILWALNFPEHRISGFITMITETLLVHVHPICLTNLCSARTATLQEHSCEFAPPAATHRKRCLTPQLPMPTPPICTKFVKLLQD